MPTLMTSDGQKVKRSTLFNGLPKPLKNLSTNIQFQQSRVMASAPLPISLFFLSIKKRVVPSWFKAYGQTVTHPTRHLSHEWPCW